MFPKKLPGEDFINSWYPILIALVMGVIFGLRNYFRGHKCQSQESVKGKVAIVTGASNGIGKETALELAQRGCRVILACRDEEKGKEACDHILNLSKNKRVSLMLLDLASLKSVRNFVKEFLKDHKRLDILINNAGIMSQPFSLTEDENELHFQTNYLGHFLLTTLLLDVMKKSPACRIINLIAPAYTLAEVDYFDDPNFKEDPDAFTSTKAYAGSKLALMYFTRTLAKELEGTKVTCNAVIPGIVNTDIYNDMPFKRSVIIRLSFTPLLWFLMKTSFDGAQMPLHLAIAKEEEGVSGKLFREFVVQEPSDLAKQDELAEKIQKLSEKLTGVKSEVREIMEDKVD